MKIIFNKIRKEAFIYDENEYPSSIDAIRSHNRKVKPQFRWDISDPIELQDYKFVHKIVF